MAATLKYSRQRESIKEYLMSTKEHPTADMVYQHVREQYPKVSLGTVYRNLNLLAELGEVNKLTCGDATDLMEILSLIIMLYVLPVIQYMILT